jgi:L-alanine-DL-glutamate epimerase-like enolase superfamily enzyme
MNTLARVQLFPVMIPRRTGFANLHVMLRLEAADGTVGWGEMSDLSHPPLYEVDLRALERMLTDLLAGQDAANLAALEERVLRFFPNEGHKYSRAGLVRQGVDLAAHDLAARARGESVAALLGGQLRDRFQVSYPIFRMRSPEAVPASLAQMESALARGFDLFRVYVGGDIQAEEQFFAQSAERFGGRVRYKSLDFSNLMPWRRSLPWAERLAECAAFSLIESPALENDDDGLREFRRRSRWPVSEHVNHVHHAWHLLHAGLVDILNVSPYVVGGLRPSLRILGLAEAAQAGVLLGTTQELDLGTAALAHLGAAARALDYAADCTGPELYTARVVRAPLRYAAGELFVPDGPGLGLEVDEALLAEHAAGARSPFSADQASLVDRTPPSRGA